MYHLKTSNTMVDHHSHLNPLFEQFHEGVQELCETALTEIASKFEIRYSEKNKNLEDENKKLEDENKNLEEINNTLQHKKKEFEKTIELLNTTLQQKKKEFEITIELLNNTLDHNNKGYKKTIELLNNKLKESSDLNIVLKKEKETETLETETLKKSNEDIKEENKLLKKEKQYLKMANTKYKRKATEDLEITVCLDKQQNDIEKYITQIRNMNKKIKLMHPEDRTTVDDIYFISEKKIFIIE
jgi:hypothetical protein